MADRNYMEYKEIDHNMDDCNGWFEKEAETKGYGISSERFLEMWEEFQKNKKTDQ